MLEGAKRNIKLFSKLLNKNISTRDIYSFLSKQAQIKKVHKGLSKPMSSAAMRSKLNDACAFTNRQRRVVNKLKRDLLKATGNRKFKQRRIIKQIRVKMDEEKHIQLSKDDKKVAR